MATNQVPTQGFQEIEVAKVNWLRGLANPGKKNVEINDQIITRGVLSILKKIKFLSFFLFCVPNAK